MQFSNANIKATLIITVLMSFLVSVGKTQQEPNTASTHWIDQTATISINNILGGHQKQQAEAPIIEDEIYEICSGASVILNEGAVLAGNITWSPITGLSDATSTQPVAKPLKTTDYVLTYTNKNGAERQAIFRVIVNPSTFASVNEDIIICAGGQAQLQAYGGVKYCWLPSANLSNAKTANPIATALTTLTYSVIVENERGCIDEKEVTVFVENDLKITVSDSLNICMDGQGTRLKATGAFTYIWSPAEGLSNPNTATPAANPTTNTLYTLTASDGICTTIKNVYVAVNNTSLRVDAGADQTICTDASVQLQANSATADAYLWTPKLGLSNRSSASPMASPAQTTVYTVEVIIIDRNNHNSILCSSFDEVTVFVEAPLPVIVVPQPPAICQGDSVQLEIEAIPNLSYSWTPNTGLSNTSIANPVAKPAQSTIYQLEISNINGCSNTYEVAVNVNTLVNATAGKDVLICKGDSIQLAAEGAETYLWDSNITLNDNNSSKPYVQPTQTTQYFVTLTTGNCSKKDTVLVKLTDAENMNEVITVCQNGAKTLQAPSGNSYFWTAETTIDNPTLPNQFIQPQVPSLYSVRINTNTCSYIKTFDIQIGEAAEATLPSFYQSCLNSEIELQLKANNLSNIEWKPNLGLNNANIAQPILTISKDTIYTVSFTVNDACTSQLSTQINVIDSISLTLNGLSFEICEGDNQNLTASGGSAYSWSPSNGLAETLGASVVASPSETTVYTVKAIDENSACSGSAQVSVSVFTFDNDAGAINDFDVCTGDAIQLKARGGSSYTWQPAELLDEPTSATPSVIDPTSLRASSIFTVRILTNDCVLEDTVKVTINDCPITLIPTAFSPNNDGVNDAWIIDGVQQNSNNQLNVYNRWGQLVYSSINYQNNWQGDFNGATLPEATYYYTLKLGSALKKGTVSIIR